MAQCIAIRADGTQCPIASKPGRAVCGIHRHYVVPVPQPDVTDYTLPEAGPHATAAAPTPQSIHEYIARDSDEWASYKPGPSCVCDTDECRRVADMAYNEPMCTTCFGSNLDGSGFNFQSRRLLLAFRRPPGTVWHQWWCHLLPRMTNRENAHQGMT